MRIATFNVQNMRLRHSDGGPRLRGARERGGGDTPEESNRTLDPIDRRLTAAVIRDADADIVALQEVFDSETLDFFHNEFLVPSGAAPYPHRICLPGNDGHGYDVALMSRFPIAEAKGHASLVPSDINLEAPAGVDPDLPVFRRDCLIARVCGLMLFVCHFKAPDPDPALAFEIRRTEALAVRKLIEQRFPEPAEALWMVIGDLNEHGKTPSAITCLTEGFSVDLLDRLPQGERWTFHIDDPDRYSRPDAMLASPLLAHRWKDAKPQLIYEGIGHGAERYTGERLEGVGEYRPHASDHAAIVIDLQPYPA
jgi:hypothetical protein